jgi:hypothetical protein
MRDRIERIALFVIWLGSSAVGLVGFWRVGSNLGWLHWRNEEPQLLMHIGTFGCAFVAASYAIYRRR